MQVTWEITASYTLYTVQRYSKPCSLKRPQECTGLKTFRTLQQLDYPLKPLCNHQGTFCHFQFEDEWSSDSFLPQTLMNTIHVQGVKSAFYPMQSYSAFIIRCLFHNSCSSNAVPWQVKRMKNSIWNILLHDVASAKQTPLLWLVQYCF